MRLMLSLALAIAALSQPGHARAQDSYVPIEQRLGSEQLQATGLGRLTPQELAALNAVLRGEQSAQAEQRQVASAGFLKQADKEPIQSQLQGSFRGWSVGTTFELANGQRWRVVEGEMHTHAVADPKVTIAPGLIGGWYLQVDGQGPRAKVRRVK